MNNKESKLTINNDFSSFYQIINEINSIIINSNNTLLLYGTDKIGFNYSNKSIKNGEMTISTSTSEQCNFISIDSEITCNKCIEEYQ